MSIFCEQICILTERNNLPITRSFFAVAGNNIKKQIWKGKKCASSSTNQEAAHR
jgi:hypothetical protein